MSVESIDLSPSAHVRSALYVGEPSVDRRSPESHIATKAYMWQGVAPALGVDPCRADLHERRHFVSSQERLISGHSIGGVHVS